MSSELARLLVSAIAGSVLGVTGSGIAVQARLTQADGIQITFERVIENTAEALQECRRDRPD